MIFKKFREFHTRKNGLQEVFNMYKGSQDLGHFTLQSLFWLFDKPLHWIKHLEYLNKKAIFGMHL